MTFYFVQVVDPRRVCGCRPDCHRSCCDADFIDDARTVYETASPAILGFA
jgi:hypothetical protein